ncbi:hypothetical protein B0H14DRAFT_2652329 [Mycena olivaceomarginata]|nr:hypothetical protein B0H14DRAFT_2652329 [Mycena olivaceomarginata]
MPSKKVESLAEKVLRLENEAKVIRTELGQEHFPAPQEAYSSPEAQSGTSKGYQIQKAMGLGRDKKRYSRLSKQDSARLDKFKVFMQKKFKYFARFEGAWPLHDLARKALQNCVRARKVDEAAEKLAEQNDDSLSTDSEGKNNCKEEPEEEEDMNSDSDSDAQSCYGSDVADESMEEDEEEEEEEHEVPPSPPKPRAKSVYFLLHSCCGKEDCSIEVSYQTNGLTQDQEDDENVLPTNKVKYLLHGSKGAVSVPPTTNNMDDEDEEAERVPARVLKKAGKTNKENVSPNKICPNVHDRNVVIRLLQRKSETRPEEDEKQEPTWKKVKSVMYLWNTLDLDHLSQTVAQDFPTQTVLRIPAKYSKNGCGEALPEASLSPYLRRLLEERQIHLGTPDNSRRTVEELEGRICARICSENKRIHVLKHGRQQGWPLSFDLMLILTFIIGLETEILDLVTNGAELGSTSLSGIDSKTLHLRNSIPVPGTRMISDDMQVSLQDAEEIRTRSIEFGQLVHWNLQDPALLAVQEFNKAAAADGIARIRTQALSSPPDNYGPQICKHKILSSILELPKHAKLF